jgi:hypothetical protein
MKTILFTAALAAIATPAVAGDVGVSININQPGLFGQINIGNVPQPPPLIYAQPMVIQEDRSYVDGPIYLHVPPGHEKHWAKHCAEYNACRRPVYFVRDDWYNNEYVPRYQHGGDRQGKHEHHDHDRKHDKDRGHDQDHDH